MGLSVFFPTAFNHFLYRVGLHNSEPRSVRARLAQCFSPVAFPTPLTSRCRSFQLMVLAAGVGWVYILAL